DNKGDSDNELRFYTESDSKATGALTASLGGMTLGAGYASNVITPVPDGDPVVSTYSIGKVRQYYKIILPKTTYPISGTLTVKDEKTQLEKELDITSVPVYEDTDFKPVLVEGQYSEGGPANERRYWAPVNVGATSTTYSASVTGCGYYFQWGRNVPFVYDSTGDIYNGPVYPDTPVGDYADKFIKTTADPNDWLSPNDDSLWQGDNAQGPCPDGWRIPTIAELTVLNSKKTTAGVVSSRITVTGVGNDLYLPANGMRENSGTWSLRSTHGRYWSSTIDGTNARGWDFNGTASYLVSFARVMGRSIRCIQK
ncbi:MAG: hypothetical protein LBR26_15005, partial [Prevotella sp.]|nr:hypothetical protein [Prevotella sp.]